MNSTIFFFCVLAAVAIVFAVFLAIANAKHLTKFDLVLAGLVVLAVAGGLMWAYMALPERTGCKNIIFTVIELGLMIIVCFTLFKLVAKYIIGIAALIAAGYFLYWLFIEGLQDGSGFGMLISLAIAGFVCLLGFGLVLRIKKALN